MNKRFIVLYFCCLHLLSAMAQPHNINTTMFKVINIKLFPKLKTFTWDTINTSKAYYTIDTVDAKNTTLTIFISNKAFKDNDAASFKKMLITLDQVKNSYSYFLRDEEMKQKQLASADDNWNTVMARNVKTCEPQFVAINKKGLDVGIDWSKVVFESFNCESRYKTLDIKNVSAKLIFKYNNRRFVVVIRDVMLSKEGWRITEMTKGLQEVD